MASRTITFLIYLCCPYMRIVSRYSIYILIMMVSLGSCSKFETVKKSSDVNFKLTKANEYFDKKEFAHANDLYKDLMPIMKSTRNYEALYFKYAYTYFYMKDYLFASYYFKNFTELFPSSKQAEECEFMAAVCMYKNSPRYTLDQTNSTKALEALQSYTDRYPKSARAAEANGYIDEMHRKLENKAADAAKLYFNIGQYKAATVAYKSVLRDYPESPNCDYYLYMIQKSWTKYADASVPEKQEERYASAISSFRDLKDSYPKSKYIEDADKLNTEANNKIKKIRDEHK